VYLSEATEEHSEEDERRIDDLYAEEAFASAGESRFNSQGSEMDNNTATPPNSSPLASVMPPSRLYDERSALLQLPLSDSGSD
jgi:hypothetical protein